MNVIMHMCKPLVPYIYYKKSYFFQYIEQLKRKYACSGKSYSIYQWEQVLIFWTAVAYPQSDTDSCYGVCHPHPTPLNIHGNTFVYKEGSRASYWTFLLAWLQLILLWHSTDCLGVLGNFVNYLPICRWFLLCKAESRDILDPSSWPALSMV